MNRRRFLYFLSSLTAASLSVPSVSSLVPDKKSCIEKYWRDARFRSDGGFMSESWVSEVQARFTWIGLLRASTTHANELQSRRRCLTCAFLALKMLY